MHRLHVNVMPHSAGYVIADERDLRRALDLAAEMRALLAGIVADDPIADNPDEGDACFFCVAARNAPHTPDCTWDRARTLLAQIDN